MKYVVITLGVVFVLALMMTSETFNVLSDLSSVLFFMFALLNMMIIGAILAIEIAKNLKYDIVQKELLALEQEMHYIAFNSDFSIEFTEEAKELQNSLKVLQQKISFLQESSYEKL